MANDNPFINFFSSMAAGAAAGRERKTLLQRAQKGQISQDEVPGMAATILQGIGRATMTPNERANQDQVKMQMASMALAQSNREKVQKLNDLKFLASQAEEARTLEEKLNDSLGFRTETARVQNLLTSRNYDALRSFTPDPSLGLSQKTTADLYAFRDNLLDSEMGKRLVEMDGMVEALRRIYPPDQIPTTYEAQKELLARTTSMEKRRIQKEALTPVLEDPNVTGASVNIEGVGTVYISKDRAKSISSKVEGMSVSAMESELRNLREKLSDPLLDTGLKNELEFQKKTIEERLIRRGSVDPIIDQEAPLSLFEQYQRQNR